MYVGHEKRTGNIWEEDGDQEEEEAVACEGKFEQSTCYTCMELPQ